MKPQMLGIGLIAAAVLAAQSTREAGLRAFRDVASVLTSPRCLNCHVPGDAPLQGEDNHTHNMKVARGDDGKGTAAMKCSGCHQEANVDARHAPPGATGWRMPAAATPMAWVGLPASKLCQVLKEPATNGKRSMSQMMEHVASDKIVLWGWTPGPGRTVPPLSHAAFVAAFQTWMDAGAPCPQ